MQKFTIANIHVRKTKRMRRQIHQMRSTRNEERKKLRKFIKSEKRKERNKKIKHGINTQIRLKWECKSKWCGHAIWNSGWNGSRHSFFKLNLSLSLFFICVSLSFFLIIFLLDSLSACIKIDNVASKAMRLKWLWPQNKVHTNQTGSNVLFLVVVVVVLVVVVALENLYLYMYNSFVLHLHRRSTQSTF